MKTIKAFTSLLAAATLALSACGAGDSAAVVVGASPVPHAQILKYVKEKPAVKDLLKSFVQTAVAKEETKYLQNKLERHEPLTRYEQERALVRDPIA